MLLDGSIIDATILRASTKTAPENVIPKELEDENRCVKKEDVCRGTPQIRAPKLPPDDTR